MSHTSFCGNNIF
jgi:RNA recognition motif-containing protein